MIQGIDHIVVVVKDLDQAAKDYEQLGFTVIPGGQHPVGSHNVLISFRDGSYLEIIAFYREALDHRWWEPLSHGERFVDFVFRPTTCAAYRSCKSPALRSTIRFRVAKGWTVTSSNGLSLATGSHRGIAPFLIEDVTPRSERTPQEFHHRNGVTGIDKVRVAVGELRQIEKWYGSLLGKRGTAITVADLGAEGLRFEVGPHIFEFLTPSDAASPLVDWLRRFGPSPYSTVLKGDALLLKPFDPRLTHGTHLFVK
jgi:catechol 2,3-dioxygenase-like lactoylglutathione lyase family enzyme